MINHTPAPWDRSLILDILSEQPEWADATDERIEADASLITASPRMLAALKGLVKTFGGLADTQPGRWPEIEAAKAIIAEMEGDKPKACEMKLTTPRGTFNIHTVYASLEDARADGWGLWFQHDRYMILSRDNRVGAVVDCEEKREP